MLILIAILSFAFTLFGGMIALRFKDKLHLILGFSAGAVISVAFFDLLPESINLGSTYYDTATIASITGLGFLLYLVLDRIIFLHFHRDDLGHGDSGVEERGVLGAGSLSLHSFFDGIAIGLAFQASTAIGIIVSIAVLVHDFSDGVNTVNLIIKSNGQSKKAFRWLIVDACAPVVGIIATSFFSVTDSLLSIILALFAGFFLYIGASELIPESHHAHPKALTTIMTLLGAVVLYFAVYFANL